MTNTETLRALDERAQDLRHLIVMDTQFGWIGETTLDLPSIERLVARGWVAEGDENCEYDITIAGRLAIEQALSAGDGVAVFTNDGNEEQRFIEHESLSCPHCGGSGHRDDVAAATAVEVDKAMVERASKAMARVRVPLVDDDGDEVSVLDALAHAFGDDDVGRANEVVWVMAEDALTAALGREGGSHGR